MKDNDGDLIEIKHEEDYIRLVVHDHTIEDTFGWAGAHLSPKKALKLAKKLARAAQEALGE